MQEPSLHPCQSCGSCCAYYRVSFYWRETEGSESATPVPLELTELYSDFRFAMKGTNRKHHARCVALTGKVGEEVACSIYTSRPSPCREFTASFEDGKTHQPRCDDARSKYQLAPLRRLDWEKWAQSQPARLCATESTCYNPSHENNPEKAPNPAAAV
jgi:Fe-S-cluster containining protein